MRFFRKYPCTMQHDASDCAAAVMSTILLEYKSEMSIMKLREIIGTDAYGTSVKGIVDGFEKLNFNVRAIRTTAKDITDDITLPAIAHMNLMEGLNHFVVIHKVLKNDRLLIADPNEGLKKMDLDEFEKSFSGVLILMIPTSEFEKISYKNKGLLDLFLALIVPQKRLLFTIILSSLLLSVIGILSSLFTKILMDEIIPFQLKNSLYIFLVIFGVVTLVQNLLTAFRQHILLYLSRKVDIPVLLGYYNHIIHLPYQFFATRKVGDIITRFQDAMTIKDIFTTVSISLVMDILLAGVTGIVLWNLNNKLFAILLIMVAINIVLIYFFKKPYKKLNQEQMEAGAMLNSQLIESMKNIETIKSQGDEKAQINRLENKFVSVLKIDYREGVLTNIQGIISMFVNSLGNLIFMGIGAISIINGNMSIGDLLVFQTLSQYFTEPIQSLVSLQLTFQEAQIAMKRLSELMTIEREDSKKDLISEVEMNGDISFKNVTFAYGSRPPIIENLNLTIPQGAKVAFVGESGAGKSTISRMLLKFMSPQEGKISISGYDIQDINYHYLRSRIAYIPQNIELFSGTIIENLRVGNPKATYEEMVLACKKSGANEFIEKLQNRYGTFVEEGGSNFSGGEKQRIAIARSIITNPDIFIFDEATSNLDSFSENKIQNIIFNQKNKKTTIIIAHRLSTIIHCDIIYYVEDGRIVERGTHKELMELNGKYAKMAAHQMSNETPTIIPTLENEQMVYE
ncbi:peptidase domain-containing ABC transporter [Niallia sp. JL1B1071]|uniref:peptidase domain-containing ABC transporter n=1 Tax=Niallia TaxID=2837506 RepID=UPI0003328723|nr:peptidase domain-containing ABC transporter [Niallia sp.]EOR23134.1 ABC transporter CbaT [Niallia nealsonii AAU1]